MTTEFNRSETVVYLRLPNWIGDLCMCLPMLHELMKQDLRIVVCARPWAKSLLSAYSFEGWVDITGKTRQDAANVRKHKQQHDHQKTVGLIVPDSISSALVFWLSGIPSAGYKDEGRSIILKWPLEKPSTPMHAVEFWYDLAVRSTSIWGVALPSTPSATLGLKLRDEADHLSAEAISRAGLTPDNYVLIAPTAIGLHKGQNKTWSQYAELHELLTLHGIAVVMCPPPNEIESAQAAAPKTPIIPSLPLDAFSALCRKAALVVCNDSGVSHLAAAAGAKQLTLFGVSSLSRTRPWSDKAHTLGDLGSWPTLHDVSEHALDLVKSTRAKT